jgi:hypothetical protein
MLIRFFHMPTSEEVLESRLAQLNRERELLLLEHQLFSSPLKAPASAALNSLSLDQKAAVCLSFIERLTTELAQQDALAQQSLETLGVLVEESESSLRRAKKEAFEFRRDVLVEGEVSEGGCSSISAETVLRWLERRLVSTDIAINKYLAKNEHLKEEISRARRRLNEPGNSKLQFIDFHEQQIEHAALETKMTAINKEIAVLKKVSTEQIEKLSKAVTELDSNRALEISDKNEISRVKTELVKAEGELATVSAERDVEKKNLRRAKLDNPLDNEEQKLDVMSLIELEIKKAALLNKKKNLSRKVEIAQGPGKTNNNVNGT